MLNKVILIGNLGQDPDVRQFETNSVASFSLATSEADIDKTGWKSRLSLVASYQCMGQSSRNSSKIPEKRE